MKRSSVLGMALVGLSGCGSIADIASDHEIVFDSPGPHVYGGVRLDAVSGTQPWMTRGAPFGILHWLDLPCSVALDTVLLPLTGVLSCIPEGRDYTTVDRRRLDQLLEEERAAVIRVTLLYVGSEDGYHFVRFSHKNRAVPPYRIQENELRIEAPFSRMADPGRSDMIKSPDDPWPLPEPLKQRRR